MQAGDRILLCGWKELVHDDRIETSLTCVAMPDAKDIIRWTTRLIDTAQSSAIPIMGNELADAQFNLIGHIACAIVPHV